MTRERERKLEIALVNLRRTYIRHTRYVRSFTSPDEASARAAVLNKELDSTEFPDVGWVVRQNPLFEEAREPASDAD